MKNYVCLSIGRHGEYPTSDNQAISLKSMVKGYLSAADIASIGGKVGAVGSSDLERAIATAYLRKKAWNCRSFEREQFGEISFEKFKEFLIGMCYESKRVSWEHLHIVTHDWHIKPLIGNDVNKDGYALIKGTDWSEIIDSLENQTAKFEIYDFNISDQELKKAIAEIGLDENMENQYALDLVVKYYKK